jgi:hypothetical protein
MNLQEIINSIESLSTELAAMMKFTNLNFAPY